MNKEFKVNMNIAANEKDSVGYISDSLKKIHETTDHGFASEEVERLLKIERELNENFKPLFENLLKISETISEGTKAFLGIFKLVAEPTFKALFRASEFGWYLSPRAISQYPISQLSEFLNEQNLFQLEQAILKDSESLAINTIKEAIKVFPHRQEILLELQQCFDKGFYSAVINLAYSQADGICNDVWNFGFFDKTKKPKYDLKTLVEFQNYSQGLASIIANQLSAKENEITMYSDDFKTNYPDKIQNSFNRHLIIHGHSLEYGNRTNAIRSILLLDFLLYFKEVKDDKTKYNRK